MSTQDPLLADTALKDALARVCAWDGLARSDRLRGILTYVVHEAMAGRGDAVKAKTIGMDVYHYGPDELTERESVVRVDVGRLRRKLEDYYTEDGRSDPVRITLPKGSYNVLFEARSQPEASDAARNVPSVTAWIIGLGLTAALGAGVILLRPAAPGPGPEPGASDTPAISPVQRSAIFETSPQRLRALNLADVGRDLIFPALGPGQLEVAEMTFEAAIAADPSFFGGPAGKAQVLAVGAVLGLAAPGSDAPLEQARELAKRALYLAPDEAWPLSAQAMVSFAERDFATARQLTRRATDLAPGDPHIIEFDALISLYAGDFERVVSESQRMEARLPGERGFVFQNASGSAKYHMGDFAGAIAAFERAIATGAPVGPPTLAYLMAATQRDGQQARAEDLARQYAETWPGTRLDLIWLRLFADPAYAEDLSGAMWAAGWRPE